MTLLAFFKFHFDTNGIFRSVYWAGVLQFYMKFQVSVHFMGQRPLNASQTRVTNHKV